MEAAAEKRRSATVLDLQAYTFYNLYWLSARGKIQGDGRKFLNRSKSYLGSQISSQSLNAIHICQLQPKSATKGEFHEE